MLKREDWQALQESLNKASKPKPTDEDWARLFARLAEEFSSAPPHSNKSQNGNEQSDCLYRVIAPPPLPNHSREN